MTCADCINYRRIMRGGSIFKVFCKIYKGSAHLSKCIDFIARKK